MPPKFIYFASQMISLAYVFPRTVTESGNQRYQDERRNHSEEEQPSAAVPVTA